MAGTTSKARASAAQAGAQVPVARPPDGVSKTAAANARFTAPLEARPSFLDWEYWTPEARKGWAGSMAMHALLLDPPGLLVFCTQHAQPAHV